VDVDDGDGLSFALVAVEPNPPPPEDGAFFFVFGFFFLALRMMVVRRVVVVAKGSGGDIERGDRQVLVPQTTIVWVWNPNVGDVNVKNVMVSSGVSTTAFRLAVRFAVFIGV